MSILSQVYELQPTNVMTSLMFSRNQMRKKRVVLYLRVCPLYPLRTSDGNPQVGSFLCHQRLRVDPRGFRRRIHAVMMKNVLITIGFAVITASQFIFGMWIMIHAARSGGMAPFSY